MSQSRDRTLYISLVSQCCIFTLQTIETSKNYIVSITFFNHKFLENHVYIMKNVNTIFEMRISIHKNYKPKQI